MDSNFIFLCSLIVHLNYIVCLLTEEQLRLLFSTPIKDGSACEENANACYMDSNKTSGQFTDASIAGNQTRSIFLISYNCIYRNFYSSFTFSVLMNLICTNLNK